MYYTTDYSSPIGTLTIAADDQSVIGLWMDGQKYFGGTVSSKLQQSDSMPVLAAATDWLDRYFAGQKPLISELPLAPIGGEFRQGVWAILRTIPYGEYITYGDIAKQMAAKMGKAKMSAQAVGGAVGHNPISIIIPCHRVVGSGGSLTGYAGGIDKKIKLLQHEGADFTDLFVPKKGTAL
ncbi:methylated-DNA--protein-cysteine methyltransferase [Actinomycetota bacterium]|nr:methylated-DNA--protein-cysteine methyltransferase [Actinomycetota bacterium]